jgi:PPOX class probable F420-dependent enzyme
MDHFLAAPRAAVVGTIRPDGSPVTSATWYEWADGRMLLTMDAAGLRIRNIRRDPRVAMTVFGDDMYTSLSVLGSAVEIREDPEFVDIDRLSLRYQGRAYEDRDWRSVSVLVEVERWHAYGEPAAAE